MNCEMVPDSDSFTAVEERLGKSDGWTQDDFGPGWDVPSLEDGSVASLPVADFETKEHDNDDNDSDKQVTKPSSLLTSKLSNETNLVENKSCKDSSDEQVADDSSTPPASIDKSRNKSDETILEDNDSCMEDSDKQVADSSTPPPSIKTVRRKSVTFFDSSTPPASIDKSVSEDTKDLEPDNANRFDDASIESDVFGSTLGGKSENSGNYTYTTDIEFDDSGDTFCLDTTNSTDVSKSTHDGTTNHNADISDIAQADFRNARHYIKPEWPFRIITAIYSERKLLVMIFLHAVATLCIWGHFALIKFSQQQAKVPVEANRYWWKVMTPTLEFGAMHAILFQMALLPLTMCRLSIASASSTFLNRFIPFNRMMRIHIHLGYTMISIVFCATLLFFGFFGMLCSDGEQEFCDKFTSEIMITGYCIIGFLLIIGITSFLRDKMPYEVFYVIHHLVFLMYFITILHTIDIKQRTNAQQRSQTFKWFAAFVLYYVCDRAAMNMNHRYSTEIAESAAVTSSSGKKGTRMTIIKLKRPVLFNFEPGQYCSLRIPDIDKTWHPFSIASGPDCDYLEFYIEVHDEKSWTNQLWEMLSANTGRCKSIEEFNGFDPRCYLVGDSSRRIKVDIRGPVGTSLGNTREFTHAIGFGSGSGVVPMMSLLKQHTQHLLRLDPESYFRAQELRDQKIGQILTHSNQGYTAKPLIQLHCLDRNTKSTTERSLSRRMSKRNVMMTDLSNSERSAERLRNQSKLARSIRDFEGLESQMTLKDIQREAFKARLPIYGNVLQLLVPILGAAIIGLIISWNTISVDMSTYPWMVVTLKCSTILFQVIFAAMTLFVHDRSEFLTYIDVIIFNISGFADWYWFAKDKWCDFTTADLFYSCLLLGYMFLRTWYNAVNVKKCDWTTQVSPSGRSTSLDKLTFIWVTRSASLVSKIAPDIIGIWNSLCDAWGEDAAAKVCDISIYVTDKDEKVRDNLTSEVFPLIQQGILRFGRPNIQKVIEKQYLDRINDKRGMPTSTLLTFCGSPHLSSIIQAAKIANDVNAVITGNEHHQMDFTSETNGSSTSSPKNTAGYRAHSEIDPEDGCGKSTASSISASALTDTHMKHL